MCFFLKILAYKKAISITGLKPAVITWSGCELLRCFHTSDFQYKELKSLLVDRNT
jgi:hypothetical protein